MVKVKEPNQNYDIKKMFVVLMGMMAKPGNLYKLYKIEQRVHPISVRGVIHFSD